MLKILTDLCFTKQKIKAKSTFAKVAYSVLVIERTYRGLFKHQWWTICNILKRND